ISTTCPTNSNRNTAVEIEENLVSTIRFLDACVAAEVPKVVFLSSGGTVYGKEHTGVCREEEEAFPITAYGVQKLGIEKILYLYQHMYGLDYRIVRLSNPYGPYQRPDGVQGAVTTFTWRALHGKPIEVYGDGSVVRDYIYIEDAIDGILRIAERQGSFRLYNLGSGTGHSLNEVLQVIAGVTDKMPQVIYRSNRSVDVPVNVLDISRFRQDFGCFEPIGLEEGIGRLVHFYEEEEYKQKGYC
ncbi:MAG: NAD-dependent epimerase/dehydratase family protein, partial [Lachnospiraceae bacterium]|nr:NAD-dependent epimerase/dehydratase family protein [Lachnospiraceae bacterium]